MIPQHPDWSSFTTPKRLLQYPHLNSVTPIAVNQAVSVGPLELSLSGGQLDQRIWFVYQANGTVHIRGVLCQQQ